MSNTDKPENKNIETKSGNSDFSEEEKLDILTLVVNGDLGAARELGNNFLKEGENSYDTKRD